MNEDFKFSGNFYDMMKMESRASVVNKSIPNGVPPGAHNGHANGIIVNGSASTSDDADAAARRAEGVASLRQKLVTVVDMIKAAQARFEVGLSCSPVTIGGNYHSMKVDPNINAITIKYLKFILLLLLFR